MAKIKLDENLVAEHVKELIEKLGVSATAEISKVDNTFFVDINSEDSSLLIGKHGANLDSLQFVLAVRIKSQIQSDDFEIFVDIDSWRKQKETKLEKMANELAQKVAQNKSEEPLYNLTASERRVIHTYLSDHSDVTTESDREGQGRYLIIKPR